jgi:hypothetical protein
MLNDILMMLCDNTVCIAFALRLQQPTRVSASFYRRFKDFLNELRQRTTTNPAAAELLEAHQEKQQNAANRAF